MVLCGYDPWNLQGGSWYVHCANRKRLMVDERYEEKPLSIGFSISEQEFELPT